MKNIFILSVIFFLLQNILAQTPGTLKWEFQTGGSINSSPAVSNNGTIYISSDKLYAINPAGTKKWEFEIDRCSSPTIDSDGIVYSSSSSPEDLYAIYPDGTQKWIFEYCQNSPAISSDGILYSGAWDRLYAIETDGTKKWELYGVGGGPYTIGPDGTIYFGSGNEFYAVNPDGKEKWTYKVGHRIRFSSVPVIGPDGTIYVGSRDHKLYALNSDGIVKWKFETGGRIFGSPAIDWENTLYIGSNDSMLYAINPDGTEKWTFKADGGVSSSPAIGSYGTIYFGSDDGKLYAVNPDGSEKWAFQTGDRIRSSPAIGADGVVYFGSEDSTLYAVYSTSFGLAESPWPKYRKNNQNQANSFNKNCPQARVAERFFSIKEGGQVTLDGSQSFDPDGKSLSYLWRIAEKSPDSPIVLTDSTSAVIAVNIPEGLYATYRFSLTVTDNKDGCSSTSVRVSTLEKWEFQTHGNVPSPAIGLDGTVYIGSDKLYAINPNGSKKWEYQTSNYFFNSPVLGSDGTIYVTSDSSIGWGSVSKRLNAINPNGTKKWTVQPVYGYWGASSIAISSTGTIYFASDSLYAINADGTRKWVFETDYFNYTSPVIGKDGIIYIGTSSSYSPDNGSLYAVNHNGTVKWKYSAGCGMYSPAISSDGTIYVFGLYVDPHSGRLANDWTSLLAINSDGTFKWKIETSGGYPVIDSNGTIYVNSDSLYAVNPDGTKKWTLQCGGGPPTIGSDGILYTGSCAINPNGTIEWNSQIGGGPPAIASDGTIYVGSDDGKLYAIYSESSGLANSPWPKIHHDNRNTGNVNTPTPITKEKIEIPNRYELFPMYPNPFNPWTHIKFALAKPGKVQINVYNILGQKVAKLLDTRKTTGTYDIIWDATLFPSGMYFIRFESGKFVNVRKCLLLK